MIPCFEKHLSKIKKKIRQMNYQNVELAYFYASAGKTLRFPKLLRIEADK